MKTHQEIKSAATIDVMIPYTETLLGIRFKHIKKYRYNVPCPFHADTPGQLHASLLAPLSAISHSPWGWVKWDHRSLIEGMK